MSGLPVRRTHLGLLIAAGVGSLAGGFHPGVADVVRAHELQRLSAGGGVLSFDPRPTPATRASNFFRGGLRRRTFKGVPMSVAEGKRRARKHRNRLRHKKQWKKAVR